MCDCFTQILILLYFKKYTNKSQICYTTLSEQQLEHIYIPNQLFLNCTHFQTSLL